MIEDRNYRFAFEITPEQRERADRLLDLHGIRRALFSLLLDEVLDLIEEHGQVVIGVMLQMAKKRQLSEVLPSLSAVKEEAAK